MSKNTKPTTYKQNADCAKCKETQNRITLCVWEIEREREREPKWEKGITQNYNTQQEQQQLSNHAKQAKKNQNAKSKIQPKTKKEKLYPKQNKHSLFQPLHINLALSPPTPTNEGKKTLHYTNKHREQST